MIFNTVLELPLCEPFFAYACVKGSHEVYGLVEETRELKITMSKC